MNPTVDKIETELIKVLSLQPGCSYIIFIPVSTGLKMQDLVYINEDIEEHHGIKATIILTAQTNGIAAIEKKEEKTHAHNDSGKTNTDKPSTGVAKTTRKKAVTQTKTVQEPADVDSGLLEVSEVGNSAIPFEKPTGEKN